MYIYDIDYENKVIVRSDSYPKIHYLTKRNEETGVLEPDKVEITKLDPVVGRKITVNVAENGYIITRNNKIRVVENGSYGETLFDTITNSLSEEKIEYRDYEKDELEDNDFINALTELNSQ